MSVRLCRALSVHETSNAETLGKPVGNDSAANKSTYSALHGIKGAYTEAEKHTKAALEATEALGGNNRFLLDLIQQLSKRIT